MRIAVTGSSGKLGRATVERLRADGHHVVGFDVVGAPGLGFVRVDLGDYGQVLDAMLGVTARHDGLDAIVHLAALPVNGLVPDAATFTNNVTATFHVLHAAVRAGIRTIVMASSITAMGFPDFANLAALPVDESYSEANVTYALGKIAEEAIAAQLVRWREGMSLMALRFTNVVAPDEYGPFERAGDPDYRRDLLHSYVDVRDGAAAVALALAHAVPGFEVYDIAAPDSGNTIPTAELARRNFPGVPIVKQLGEFETLMSIDKAARRLGFRPQHLWRDEYAHWQRENS
ncbi:NAD-dependent epimerase/dehydratase family protein [Rathayibacter soli]|uniref:NAD-dependent epimerase/dehydratase family protein n=1 Tax=Rathayibacter soli TaxID=3144168 RepID=UPI0027E59678|nr:NAD(P)-dependent oxidoreductase [Glaciibacter superstes]